MMMARAVSEPEAARHVRLWGESRPVHQLYRECGGTALVSARAKSCRH